MADKSTISPSFLNPTQQNLSVNHRQSTVNSLEDSSRWYVKTHHNSPTYHDFYMSKSLKIHQFPEVCRLSLDVSCCLPSPEPGPAAPPWPMAAARTVACGCRRWRAPSVRRPPVPGDGGRMWWSKVRADQGWDSWDGEYFHDFHGI